jgi:hypothetical protein
MPFLSPAPCTPLHPHHGLPDLAAARLAEPVGAVPAVPDRRGAGAAVPHRRSGSSPVRSPPPHASTTLRGQIRQDQSEPEQPALAGEERIVLPHRRLGRTRRRRPRPVWFVEAGRRTGMRCLLPGIREEAGAYSSLFL